MAVQKMKHQPHLHSCSSTSTIPIPPLHPLLNLKMFVGTWNVGGKTPHGHGAGLDLREWLCRSSTSPPPDIYVLGFQEIVPLNARNVFGPEDKGPSTTWLSLIGQALNDPSKSSNIYTNATADPSASRMDEELAYRLVASRQMVGIFLCVWIRTRVARHVTNVRMSCVGTGLVGYLGNKGAVSISMTLRRSSFCFVCTHLASGEKEGDELERNLDVAEILRRTKFAQSPRFSISRPTTIMEHDKIIWFGDLNYRLVPGCWRGGDALELLRRKDWQALFERDQLRVQQRNGQALSGWEEGSIRFPPTYKYIPNSDRYVAAAARVAKSGAKRRTPAWCDRILWRGKGMKQIMYSRKELRFSDHRPVYSLFSIDDQPASTATATAPNHSSSSSNCGSSCSRIQAEELLLLTRTRSCCSSIQTSRFCLVS